MSFYLIALAGVLIHFVIKFQKHIDARESKKINWKKELEKWGWQRQVFNTIISLILAMALVYFKGYIESMFGEIKELGIFFLGYFSDSIFKNVSERYEKKYKVERK